MAKFARPNSYTGKQSNQHWTGDVRAANADEASAGVSQSLYISPATLASAVDDLLPDATTTSKGKVELATLSELQNGNAPAGAWVPTSNDVATVIAGIVVGAVPPATETQQGIAEIATQAETNTGTDDARIVTPLKLATYVAGGAGAGSFTDLTATGAVSFTGATGGLTMTSATASSLGVTGAGIDLTLDSAAGQLILTGGEAAANAVRIQADDAGGGIDIDAGTLGIAVDTTGALSLDSAGATNLTATGAFDLTVNTTGGSLIFTAGENAADSIQITSSIGGIDITAAAASAGEDIDISALGSSVNITSTENAALAIFIHANGGTSETIRVHADQGTGAGSIDLLSDAGGVTITGGAANADAINIVASNGAGGIDIDSGTGGIVADSTGKFTFTSTNDAAQAFYLHANGGTSETIQLHADQGTGVASLNFLSDVGGLTLRSAGLASADAINLEAVLGGIDADAALQINITSSQAAVNALRLFASGVAGGIDIDAGTGGITVDSTGALSLDAAAASNLTVTGAFDLTVNTTAGSLNLAAGEAAADAISIQAAAGGLDVDGALQINIASSQAAATAIRLNASNAGGGFDIDSGTGGFIVDTTGAVSLDSALASNFTVTGAADLTLASSAGAVNVTSGEANADSINVTSGGGMNIVATGAAAKDIIVTCTSGSMTLTAGENISDAMKLTASGGASGITLTAGTNSVKFASGLIVKTTDVANAASPYTVLGTDYFISVDTSGGAVTVTLPAASAVTGRTFVIRDTGGAAAASNITIGGGGTNLVGGGASAATKVISAAYAGATVYSNGVTWNYAYVA